MRQLFFRTISISAIIVLAAAMIAIPVFSTQAFAQDTAGITAKAAAGGVEGTKVAAVAGAGAAGAGAGAVTAGGVTAGTVVAATVLVGSAVAWTIGATDTDSTSHH